MTTPEHIIGEEYQFQGTFQAGASICPVCVLSTMMKSLQGVAPMALHLDLGCSSQVLNSVCSHHRGLSKWVTSRLESAPQIDQSEAEPAHHDPKVNYLTMQH